MHRVAPAQCHFIEREKKNVSKRVAPKLHRIALAHCRFIKEGAIKTTKKEAQTLKEALRDIQPLQKQKDDDMTITQMHPRKDTLTLTLTP